MDSQYKVATYVAIYGVIGAVISLIVFDTTIMTSFILGLMTAMMNYSLMIKATRKSFLRPEGKRTGYIVTQTVLRLVIYGVVLYIASIDARFDIIATFVGMLSVKIVYYLLLLLKKEV